MAENKSILVQLGLSKSQIKQLPKSIVDEAAVIDGVRGIVSAMPEGVRKDIMQQAVVEAIDIFKNNLLQQEEVELTEEQKKQIEDYKSQEQEEREQKGDTGEQEEPKESGQEEPVDDKQPEGEDQPEDGGEKQPKEGGEEEEPKDDRKRRRDDDDDDTGSSGKGKGKDQGGEDLPKTKGGSGGGGGGGTPPIDIPDDEYPIPDLTDEQVKYLEEKFFKNPLYSRKPDYKSTKWDKENLKFFNLNLEEFLYVYGLFSQKSSGDDIYLSEPNLFSVIKYLWEFNKGYEAKVLDRYYIYTQYVPFLMFVAAAPHVHTGYIPDAEVWGYNADNGVNIYKELKFSIPNYSKQLYERGYYAGVAEEADYEYFSTQPLVLHIAYTATDKNRLKQFLRWSTKFFNNRLYYTNNYKGNGIVLENRIVTDKALNYYIERYKNQPFDLPETESTSRGIIKKKEDDEITVTKQPLSIYDYEKFYGGQKWFFRLGREKAIYLARTFRKFENASAWVGFPYELVFQSNIDGEEHNINAISAYAVLQKFLSLNRPDDFTLGISERDAYSLLMHKEGGDFDIESETEFQSFGVYELSLEPRLSVKFPFPYISNTLEWIKVGAIKIKSEPTPEPAKPAKKTRKKKEYTAEQQEIVDEISALKQALKYTSGDESESIKQEIEALKQSLKYL